MREVNRSNEAGGNTASSISSSRRCAPPALPAAQPSGAPRPRSSTAPSRHWRPAARISSALPFARTRSNSLVEGRWPHGSKCPWRRGAAQARPPTGPLAPAFRHMIGDGFRHCSADRAAIRSADYLRCLRSGAHRMVATAELSRRCAQMRGEESLRHSGRRRWDDACRKASSEKFGAAERPSGSTEKALDLADGNSVNLCHLGNLDAVSHPSPDARHVRGWNLGWRRHGHDRSCRLIVPGWCRRRDDAQHTRFARRWVGGRGLLIGWRGDW
jgi:hypothetical protein